MVLHQRGSLQRNHRSQTHHGRNGFHLRDDLFAPRPFPSARQIHHSLNSYFQTSILFSDNFFLIIAIRYDKHPHFFSIMCIDAGVLILTSIYQSSQPFAHTFDSWKTQSVLIIWLYVVLTVSVHGPSHDTSALISVGAILGSKLNGVGFSVGGGQTSIHHSIVCVSNRSSSNVTNSYTLTSLEFGFDWSMSYEKKSKQ